MLFKTLLSATLCTFVAARAVESPENLIIPRNNIVLADGTGMQYGTLATEGLIWQASGVLTKGGCSTIQHITDCYELDLGNNPSTQLDPGSATPRQRIEFASPHQNDGTSWKYTWKSYLQSTDTGSHSFFHIMQIFSATDDGPAFFLDILSSGASFEDVKAGSVVATARLAAILATPLQHSLTVTYGPTGSLNYTITNLQTGASILKYSKIGPTGSGGNYLKFGMYRATYFGMPSLKSWYGDYTVQQL